MHATRLSCLVFEDMLQMRQAMLMQERAVCIVCARGLTGAHRLQRLLHATHTAATLSFEQLIA